MPIIKVVENQRFENFPVLSTAHFVEIFPYFQIKLPIFKLGLNG
jgi:hypothetical protein